MNWLESASGRKSGVNRIMEQDAIHEFLSLGG